MKNLSNNFWNRLHYNINRIGMFGRVGKWYNTQYSLCVYFWMTAANLFISIPFYLFIAFNVGTPLIVAPIVAIVSFFTEVTDAWVAFVPIGIAVLIAYATTIILCIIAASIFWVKEEKPFSFQHREKVEKEPGLIRSYLKARKEKFCPIISLDDIANNKKD